MKTPFAQRLREGTPPIGTLLTTASCEVAEVIMTAGFDWVFLDMEHGAMDPVDVQTLLQALAAGPPALVRIPELGEAWFKKALDAGADGVIVPLVRTAADARLAVAFSKYPPLGSRSVGIGRAHGYGQELEAYLERANRTVATILQIEHIDAVGHLDDILAVPGIDAAFIGPYDLSGSMGRVGDPSHPSVREAIAGIRRACRERGVPVGIFATSAETAAEELAAGCSYVAVGSDLAMLASVAGQTLRATRQALARGGR